LQSHPKKENQKAWKLKQVATPGHIASKCSFCASVAAFQNTNFKTPKTFPWNWGWHLLKLLLFTQLQLQVFHEAASQGIVLQCLCWHCYWEGHTCHPRGQHAGIASKAAG
jgi:hypothetical protein